MVRASGATAFQSRINTLLILAAIARLERIVKLWAIASLVILSFIAMVVTAAKPMNDKLSISKAEDPDFFDWWINPAKDGSPEPDPEELAGVQNYISQVYTSETQADIQIHVRSKREY